MANDRAESFRKTQIKQVVAQTETTQMVVERQQQMIVGLSFKLFNLERTLAGYAQTRSAAQAADYRSLAISKLLDKVGISEDMVKAKTTEMQIADFEETSSEDDKVRNLSVITTRPIQNGDIVIGAVKLYKDNVELQDEGIVRSKIEIGKNELFQDLDAVLLGANVGDARRIPLNLKDRTDQAEFTVLGIRQAPSESPGAVPPNENVASPGDLTLMGLRNPDDSGSAAPTNPGV